jgi:enoyl-CoA hydratase/carnithine racemase
VTARVLVERRSSDVVTLILNRPEKRNALDFDLLDALTRSVVEEGARASVVILRGAGREAFSSGFDLDALTGTASDLEADAAVGRAADALRDCPVPVIAQLEGHCHGAAVDLALHCDLRIATDGLNFSLWAVELGVVYRTELLSRLVAITGFARAEHLLFAMPVLDAATALSWGLVGEITPASQIDMRIDQIATRLAGAPRSAVTGTKATFALFARDEDIVRTAAPWRSAAASSDERMSALNAARARLGRPPQR